MSNGVVRASGALLGGTRAGGAHQAAAAEVITDLLSRGHAVRFRASGDSMHPIIRSNDYLLVEPAAKLRIRRGDVVLTIANRGLTAHRVIGFAGGALITRGDNAHQDDAPIELARVLGQVTHAERDGSTRRVRNATSVFLTLQRLFARVSARW